MNGATIIDGKAFAADLRARVAERAAAFIATSGTTPGLAVVLVGEDPASQVYVRNKAKQTVECGMRSFEHRLSVETSQGDLLDLVHRLNADPAVNGILVQLPLPPQIDEAAVLAAIDPARYEQLDVGPERTIEARVLRRTRNGRGGRRRLRLPLRPQRGRLRRRARPSSRHRHHHRRPCRPARPLPGRSPGVRSWW